LLTKENVALNTKTIPEILRKNNKVLELKIEDNLTTFAVSYETEGVSLEGSFLKIPELSIKKDNFTLTWG
jgi:hypothetical protein